MQFLLYYMNMDKKNKFLLVAFLLLVILSIFLTYKRSFIDRDFEIIDSGSEEIYE